MDVILHIGAHRTAVGSLHRLLLDQDRALRDAGIVFWPPARLRGGLVSGLFDGLGPDAGLPPRAARAAGRVRVGLERLEKAGTRALIVSDPGLLGDPMLCLWRSRAYPDAARRLARVAEVFDHRITRVALSLRAYDGFWGSALAAGIARGLPFPDRAALDRMVTQPHRWRTLADAAAAAFARSERLCWTFERLGARPEAQAQILTGGVLQLPPTRVISNPSPGLAALRPRLGPADAARLPVGAGRWHPFSEDQRDALLAQYWDDLDWFRAEGGQAMTFHQEPVTPKAPKSAVRPRRVRGPNHDRQDRPLESAG